MMGYLTTFTIYNDGISNLSNLKENAYEFSQSLIESVANYDPPDYPKVVSCGNFSNFCKVHKPRHADSHTLYVHAGNTVCEMNPYSQETHNLIRKNPKFFETLMTEIKNQYKELRRVQKELV